MKRIFGQRPKDENFSTFLGEAPIPSKKRFLLEECKKHDVSPYVDDATESSSGVYSAIRGVASEAELEKRLIAKKTFRLACRAHVVAILAFLVSLAALVKSYL